uniref:Uncharacterized protein n=1 Tax=Ditylenchus dipsaci TaxID=166011 RepID=A0A915EE13_9BILA
MSSFSSIASSSIITEQEEENRVKAGDLGFSAQALPAPMADLVKGLKTRSLYWRTDEGEPAVGKSNRRVRFKEAVPAALLVNREGQCVLRCTPVDNPASSSSNSSSGSPIRTSNEGDLLAGSPNAGVMASGNQHHFSSSSSSCCSPLPRPSPSFSTPNHQQLNSLHSPRVLPPSMSSLTASSSSSRYRCMCGGCHVVIGTKCFLVLYVWLTVCGLLFGMVSAMVWALIPLLVIPISAYGLVNHKPKYLYPLLIVTVIHLIVCLLMVVIVGVFALFNYNTLLAIFAYSTAEKPSSILLLVLLVTILGCFLLAALFFWQILVISSCIQYYECWQKRHPPQTSTKAAKVNHLNDRLPTTHSIGGH